LGNFTFFPEQFFFLGTQHLCQETTERW